MKQIDNPAFYNSEMESKYFRLYLAYLFLNHQKNKETDVYSLRIIKFKLRYYEVSKQNKFLNDLSKNSNSFLKYLEPTGLKRKVDKGALKLGITPYDQLEEKQNDFVMH